MKVSELNRHFARFKELRILVIGDVMIDSYIWGSVERISPEAPVPVVSIHSREKRLGGAANVALNIRALGASPILCSVIGDDRGKDEFIGLLTREELTDIGIVVDRSRMTTQKTRVISHHQHLMRIDEEIDRVLLPGPGKKFTSQVIELIKNGNIDAVVFQDYDKGIISPGLIRSVVDMASRAGIPVLADPKRRNFSEYRNIEVFKPNFREFIEGLHVDIRKGDFPSIHQAVRQHLHDKQGIRSVLITLSELGIFVSDSDSYRNIPSEVRDISDVSGAGDTVIAVTAVGYAAGMDIFRSAELANIAGGQVCGKVGVVPVSRDHLYQESVKLMCD